MTTYQLRLCKILARFFTRGSNGGQLGCALCSSNGGQLGCALCSSNGGQLGCALSSSNGGQLGCALCSSNGGQLGCALSSSNGGQLGCALCSSNGGMSITIYEVSKPGPQKHVWPGLLHEVSMTAFEQLADHNAFVW